MSEQKHSKPETWLRLARKCKDSDLAEYLRALAIEPSEASSHIQSEQQIARYHPEDEDMARRVGLIISEAMV